MLTRKGAIQSLRYAAVVALAMAPTIFLFISHRYPHSIGSLRDYEKYYRYKERRYTVGEYVAVRIIFSITIICLFFYQICLIVKYHSLWYELKKKYQDIEIPYRMPLFSKKYENAYPFTEEEVKKSLKSLKYKSISVSIVMLIMIISVGIFK